MGYRYIALIAGPRITTAGLLVAEKSLLAAGLQHRLTAGPMILYASEDTPTMLLPNDCALIGHLFQRDGTRVVEGTQIPTTSDSNSLIPNLLENFWGEYLVLQPVSRERSEFVIMRDPSGGVGCVYVMHGDGTAFITSDITLAEQIGLYQRKVDWDYITRSLTFPYQKTTSTGLLEVSELLPGCGLRALGKNVSMEQHWNPWDFVSKPHRHEVPSDAVLEVRQAVISAVRAWADVDRSVLLELSGGLDSSVVAACLQGASAQVTCCTLMTPVPGADERQYASAIAAEFGFPLHTKMLDFGHADVSFRPSVSTTSPRVGALQRAIDTVMMAVAEEHSTTSFFSGSGGDTVFCHLTNAAPAADAFKELGIERGISALHDLATLHQCTLWTAARLTLRKLLLRPKSPRVRQGTFVARASLTATPDDHPWFSAPKDALPGDRERVFGLVDTLVYRETASRATHRWRRMPLLAQPVIEACLKTPSWMWIEGGQNRAVARAAFADMLPPEIAHRRSKGNFVGYLGGVYRRHRQDIRELLLSGLLSERRLLDTKTLSDFLDREDLPIRDNTFLEVFDLCTTENWLRHQH